MFRELQCFKAYDIRGEVGVSLDDDVMYRVGRAVTYHFSAKMVVVGFDARETSPIFAKAVSRGILDAGADALLIGLSGTEEMYCTVSEFDACAGLVVTASHNPINYNGVKIVKSGSRPLDNEKDFQVIKGLAEGGLWTASSHTGESRDVQCVAREKYLNRVSKNIVNILILIIKFIKLKNLRNDHLLGLRLRF